MVIMNLLIIIILIDNNNRLIDEINDYNKINDFEVKTVERIDFIHLVQILRIFLRIKCYE